MTLPLSNAQPAERPEEALLVPPRSFGIAEKLVSDARLILVILVDSINEKGDPSRVSVH